MAPLRRRTANQPTAAASRWLGAALLTALSLGVYLAAGWGLYRLGLWVLGRALAAGIPATGTDGGQW